MNYKWVIFEITKKCTNHCPICFQRDIDFEDVTMDEFKRVLKELGPGPEIRLLGGEPTLHPNFIEMLEFIHENGNDANFSTNGYVLSQNKEMVDKLFEIEKSGKLTANVSMNGGLSVEKTIQLDGKNDLPIKLKCLDNLKGLENLSVSMVIDRGVNEDNIEDIFEIQKKYNVKNLLFRGNIMDKNSYKTNEFLYLMLSKNLFTRRDMAKFYISGFMSKKCRGKHCCIGILKNNINVFFHEAWNSCWSVGRYDQTTKEVISFWER